MSSSTDSLTGRVVRQGDWGFERARLGWNQLYSSHPEAVVFCAETADVVNALTWARHNGIHVRIRSGRHCLEGWSAVDGGLVIDVSALKTAQIDALTSFDQNTGQGPQVIAQSKGDPAAIGAAIAAGPTTMGGKVLPGLVARRQQEAGMFAGGPPAAGGAAPGGSVEPTAGDGTSTAPNATPGGANDPVAANAFATANQMEQRASELEQPINTAKFWQAQGLPVQVPVGDPQAIRQAAQR